jgi:hypothetical protein
MEGWKPLHHPTATYLIGFKKPSGRLKKPGLRSDSATSSVAYRMSIRFPLSQLVGWVGKGGGAEVDTGWPG